MEGQAWTIVSITCLMALLSDGVISDCSITKILERFNYYLRLGSGRYKSMPKGLGKSPQFSSVPKYCFSLLNKINKIIFLKIKRRGRKKF